MQVKVSILLVHFFIVVVVVAVVIVICLMRVHDHSLSRVKLSNMQFCDEQYTLVFEVGTLANALSRILKVAQNVDSE